MQLLFDINRSLKVNPPNYGKGIIFIERKQGKLSSLITEDDKGNSLQPREKKLDDSQRTIAHSYKQNGCLYDKQVMVTEQRDDNLEELISGFGRKAALQNDLNVDNYFWDKVKFESPYWKAVHKRRLNASKDHVGKGTPNTEGTYLKGLVELKSENAFNYRDDDAVREALFDMSNGQLDEKQVEKLFNKFRKENSKSITINAFSKEEANKAADKLGLPYKGKVKDISSKSFDKLGFVLYGGNLDSKLITYAKHYAYYKQQISIIGYIQHTELDEETIKKGRKTFVDDIEESQKTIEKYFDKSFHNMIKFEGFLAQIETPDKSQGGKPKERGLVDKNGKIIKDV